MADQVLDRIVAISIDKLVTPQIAGGLDQIDDRPRRVFFQIRCLGAPEALFELLPTTLLSDIDLGDPEGRERVNRHRLVTKALGEFQGSFAPRLNDLVIGDADQVTLGESRIGPG